MSLEATSTSSKAEFERGLKIALALAVLILSVVSVVGHEGRRAAAQAVMREQTAPVAQARVARGPRPLAKAPSLSLAEAPIGRVLPPLLPTLAAPTATQPAARLGGPSPTSVTAAAEQMGPPAPRLRLLSRPVAIDSATFQVGSGQIKLVGVKALATSEICGKDALAWPCGMQARTALRAWLRSRSIGCTVPEDFGRRDQTITARCQLGQDDIALWLVENGWAHALDTSRYSIVEDKAREGGRGMWREGGPATPSGE